MRAEMYMSFAAAALLAAFSPQDEQAAKVGALVEDLRSDRLEAREAATAKLAELGPEALQEVEKFLSDPDAEVSARIRSIARLLRLKKHVTPGLIKAVPDVLKRLVSPNPADRVSLFIRILEKERSVPDLHRVFASELAPLALAGAETREVRKSVLKWVAEYHLTSAMPEVLKMIQEDIEFLAAIKTAWDLRSREPIQFWLKRFDSAADIEVIFMTWYLINLQPRELIEPMMFRLKDTREFGREAAMEILAWMNHWESAGRIAELLEDSSPSVVGCAAKALGRLGHLESVPKLRRILSESDDEWCLSGVAEALGELGSRESIPRLEEILRRKPSEVPSGAVQALVALGHSKSAPRLAELLESKEESLTWSCTEGISRLGAREYIPNLVRQLRDGDASHRMIAQFGLEVMGTPTDLKAIIACAKEGSIEAIALLGALGTRDECPLLIGFLESSSLEVVVAAVKSLGSV